LLIVEGALNDLQKNTFELELELVFWFLSIVVDSTNRHDIKSNRHDSLL